MGNVMRFWFLSELLIEVLSASRYGHFSSAKEFRSQCHIFRFESRLVGKSPSGGKNQWKQHLRIQEGHFLNIALNLVLTLPDDGECPALLISCGIIDLGAFCVELWSFFVSKRNSVPMSYISLWEHLLISFDFCRAAGIKDAFNDRGGIKDVF